MADVSSDIKDWSTTASSNSPADATTIGSGLADNFQQIQATVVTAFRHKGSDIASATTTDLGGTVGLYHDITGTTTITGFGSTAATGTWKLLQFDGALQITYNATSMILPGNANITTAAGDMAMVIHEGSGNWRMLWYTDDSANISPPFQTSDGGVAIIADASDSTKAVDFDLSGLTTATTRTITVPDGDITLNDAIVNLTADATPVPGTDYLKTYDASATAEKKVLLDKVSGGVLMSEVTTTGVTEIDFTSIPAGVTHIDVFFEGFSHSDAERTNVQLITGGGVVTTGYVSTGTKLPNAAAIETVNSTSSFVFNDSDASFAMHGVLRLTLSDATNHTWIGAGHCLLSTAQSTITTGSVTLSAALTGVRITMDGVATVDAGTVNVRYR